ncbi:MAG TPA: nuclear transport factor 2 family protein [Acidobacteriota bacterium]|nr:nuclear transport factor 2 family protein [Acidobacteriota bacterium]
MNTPQETVRQFYAALNRGDVPAVTAHFDPEIVRTEFEGTPNAGTYRGLAALEAHVAKGRGTWAEGACEPEEFFEHGDKVVAYVHVRVRLKDSGQWVEGRIADGFAFRGGKMVEFHTFEKRADAVAWAGMTD